MEIKYQNRPSDIEAYARLLYLKSPMIKKHRSRSINFAAVMIAIIAITIFYVDKPSTVALWLAFSIAWLIYIPVQHRRKYVKNVLKQYSDAKHENLFGEHLVTIDGDFICDQIEKGINKTEIRKFEHFEQTETHLFIFLDSSIAYIIPADQLAKNDYEKFISLLKEKRTA